MEKNHNLSIYLQWFWVSTFRKNSSRLFEILTSKPFTLYSEKKSKWYIWSYSHSLLPILMLSFSYHLIFCSIVFFSIFIAIENCIFLCYCLHCPSKKNDSDPLKYEMCLGPEEAEFWVVTSACKSLAFMGNSCADSLKSPALS